MASIRSFAVATVVTLALSFVLPATAQTAKPKQTKPATTGRATTTRTTTTQRRSNMAAAAPMAGNNTATVQANITKANKTLSDMVALLNKIEARKAGK